MLINLIRRGGKVRFACAAAGVAVAAGAVVFMFSLTATNRAQAPALAARAAAPWAAWRFDWPMGPRGPRGSVSADDSGSGRGSRPASPRSRETRDPTDVALHDTGLKLELVGATIDLRPGGRVLQGPPMRAVLSLAPAANPAGG